MALPVPEHLPAPTTASATEAAIPSSALASPVKALPDSVNKTTNTPETTEGSHDFTGTLEPFDLRQVLPQSDGSASIELNQAFLSLSKAQLQEAMWEQGQSTLLQKNTAQHYATFLILYGWS
ncbi:hypothetical protein [Alishewanella sp. HL-SH06]|uniref:hypothetical protein n=1 Tax=Alishewanella sp. HL-SH06 TaxID=3461144 RepID=UPI0040413987